MKRLILFLLLLIPFLGDAQTSTAPLGQKGKITHVLGLLVIDEGPTIMKLLDTTTAKTVYPDAPMSGRIGVQGTNVYFHNGVKFIPLGSGGSTIDTNRLVKYSDTAAMLAGYLLRKDTIFLSNRINDRVKYTDTALMLSPYIRSNLALKIADTSSMLANYLRKADTASLSNRINQRVKYSDTAVMLANIYAMLQGKVNYTDTAGMLFNIYTGLNQRVKYSDTALMLSNIYAALNGRVRYTDTAAMLSNIYTLINGRLKYTDTSGMLANIYTMLATKVSAGTLVAGYLPKADAAKNIVNSIVSEGSGIINISGKLGVGAGVIPDSTLQIDGGLYTNRGVRHTNLPSGRGLKQLRVDANGIVSAVDTTAGGSGGITGSGTTNRLAIFTSSTALGNSNFYQDATGSYAAVHGTPTSGVGFSIFGPSNYAIEFVPGTGGGNFIQSYDRGGSAFKDLKISALSFHTQISGVDADVIQANNGRLIGGATSAGPNSISAGLISEANGTQAGSFGVGAKAQGTRSTALGPQGTAGFGEDMVISVGGASPSTTRVGQMLLYAYDGFDFQKSVGTNGIRLYPPSPSGNIAEFNGRIFGIQANFGSGNTFNGSNNHIMGENLTITSGASYSSMIGGFSNTLNSTAYISGIVGGSGNQNGGTNCWVFGNGGNIQGGNNNHIFGGGNGVIFGTAADRNNMFGSYNAAIDDGRDDNTIMCRDGYSHHNGTFMIGDGNPDAGYFNTTVDNGGYIRAKGGLFIHKNAATKIITMGVSGDSTLSVTGSIKSTSTVLANQYANTIQTLTDGATTTWDGDLGGQAIWTIGGTGRTLTITNPKAGAFYTLKLIQGSGGSKTITTYPTNTKWSGGTAPTLTTTAGAVDIISFWYDGTNYNAMYSLDVK